MGDRKPRVRKSNSAVSSSSSSSTSSFSSDEEADARDLKPIRGYLGNRRELARQLFKSVKSDKIRMMLPQILKNMNLNDLEEWCASELCGMSEARIISIVNGQPMLDSSDTSETDDSGPSLEIISDTEEWLTDTDVPIKEEPSSSGALKTKKFKANKAKSKNVTGKKNDSEKARVKAKGKTNSTPVIDSDVKVKKEKEKDNRPAANKEGESLLDLLELEMRARAIRALIRKEEDIIPSAASEKRLAMSANALRNTLNSAVSASLSSEKSLNGTLNLGESSNNADKNSLNEPGRNTNNAQVADDEDVVFVVAQPTPTIELLSSDNDEETANETKKDKKKESTSATPIEPLNLRQNKNDKTSDIVTSRDNAIAINERVVTIDKSGGGADNFKIVITKRVSESSNSPSPSKSSKSKKNSAERADRNIAVGTANANETSDKSLAEIEQTGKGLFKKIKKKQNLRNKRKLNTDDANTDRTTVAKTLETSSTDVNDKDKSAGSPIANEAKVDDSNEKNLTELPQVRTVKLESEESREVTKTDEREVKRKARRRITLDEDRLDDFEEIIDLDNYSDDMEDMENIGESKSVNNENDVAKEKPVQEKQKTLAVDSGVKDQSESSETWATRYYQTDDVQNVIKESKIQSEIRKRLRERQRQSKINSSPKLNSPGDATVASDKTEEKFEPKPTGSVQEYLALKNSTASPNNDIDSTVEETDPNTSDRKVIDVNQGNTPPAVEENTTTPTASNSSRELTTEIMSNEAIEGQ